jgi:hypothetical protein
MDIPKTTRQFYPDEQRILKAILTKTTKEVKTKIKYHYFLIAAVIAIICTYLATIIKFDFLGFVFGIISILGYGFIVFMPYEIFKDRKKIKNFMQTLQSFIDKGTVDTFHVKSVRIALAPEFDDESDLYLVELDNGKVLYLWDTEYNLNKKFPCSDFEIYEDKFFKLTGRQIYPLSDKIQPIRIDKKAKWNYMKQYGTMEHLYIESINFDELLEKYKACA